MSKNFRNSICLLIIIVILTSCKNSYSFLLPDATCESPCWNGITPGKTTEEQLVADLKTIPIVAKDSIITNGGPRYIFDNLVFFSLPLEVKAIAFILKNKVVMILFSEKLGITIGQVVEKVGQPEYIITYPAFQPSFFGDSKDILVTIIFPSQGIAIEYNAGRMNRALRSEINPERRVEWILYFDPDKLQAILEDGMFTPHSLDLTAWQVKKLLQSWNGYGVIGEKYPPVDYK